MGNNGIILSVGGVYMYIAIDKMLKKRGVSRYRLSKEINYSYQRLMKLANNETKSISFDILEAICIYLDCTPSDILIIEKDER